MNDIWRTFDKCLNIYRTYDRLVGTKIFTLEMNKIFMQASKILRPLVTGMIGFANYLAQIAHFISYKKWVHNDKYPNNTHLPCAAIVRDVVGSGCNGCSYFVTLGENSKDKASERICRRQLLLDKLFTRIHTLFISSSQIKLIRGTAIEVKSTLQLPLSVVYKHYNLFFLLIIICAKKFVMVGGPGCESAQ